MVEKAAERPWTADEFLAWAQHQEHTWELVSGFPRLKFMAGGERRHHEISGNAYFALRNLVKLPCRPFTSDMAVRTSETQVRFPDASVDCGDRNLDEHEADKPTLIVEVLSSSTRHFDVFGKLEEYRGVPSIEYVLLIEARTCGVALHSRSEHGRWHIETFERLDAMIELPQIGIVLPVANLYGDLPLEPQLKVVRE